MKFRSVYQRFESKPAPVGTPVDKEYGLKIDESGKEYLAEIGTIPRYQVVQAHLDNSKIRSVVEQYQKGDMTVLNKRVGQFIDVTKYPQTLAEAQNTLIEAERIFNNAPLEVRKEYDHSLVQFLNAINDGSFEARFAKKNEIAETVEAATVSPNLMADSAVETIVKEVKV